MLSESQVNPPVASAEAVTITVQSGGRQTFAGFGTSLGNWGGDYQKLAAAERDRLAGLLWGGLRMKCIRLWINLDEYAPQPGKRLTADFRSRYIDSGIVADALRSGVVDLLLAPDAMPPAMKVKRAGGPHDFALRDDAVSDYATLIAEFIAQIRAETGGLDHRDRFAKRTQRPRSDCPRADAPTGQGPPPRAGWARFAGRPDHCPGERQRRLDAVRCDRRRARR